MPTPLLCPFLRFPHLLGCIFGIAILLVYLTLGNSGQFIKDFHGSMFSIYFLRFLHAFTLLYIKDI